LTLRKVTETERERVEGHALFLFLFLFLLLIPQGVLFQFLFIADGQFVTAFCATAGQHFSAIGSLHPFTEAVNGLTAAAMGLKCTFHFKSVFSLLRNGPGRTGFVSVLPTGHHTRWFCERTAKVRGGDQIYDFLILEF
jgi:uncharacterized membrane protein AbrB (regulator of aidB expression)